MKKEIIRRALVTGASGYIGSNLVDRLIEKGWDVTVLGRKSKNFSIYCSKTNNVECYELKKNNINKIIKTVKPDIVFHCASLVPSNKSKNFLPEDFINSNILFGVNLLEAMATNNIKNFINLGSYWEHFNNEIYNPVDFYAATKCSFSSFIKYYQEVHGLRSSTLELFDVYGPNDKRNKIIDLLFQALNNKSELKMSPGYQKLNFLYISDVIDALIELANMILSNDKVLMDRYALRSNQVYTLRETVKIIEEITNKKIKIKWSSLDYKNRTIMSPPDVIQSFPNFKPKTSFNDGLRLVYKQYQTSK